MLRAKLFEGPCRSAVGLVLHQVEGQAVHAAPDSAGFAGAAGRLNRRWHGRRHRQPAATDATARCRTHRHLRQATDEEHGHDCADGAVRDRRRRGVAARPRHRVRQGMVDRLESVPRVVHQRHPVGASSAGPGNEGGDHRHGRDHGDGDAHCRSTRHPRRRLSQRVRTHTPVRPSHAQRDALQRTLLESAIRSGRYELARFLASERLGVRDNGVYNWTQRARALRGLGDTAGAEAADRRAAANRDKFANA